MSLQGGQAAMFLRTISHSEIWLTLVSQQMSFDYALKKKQTPKFSVSAWVQIC